MRHVVMVADDGDALLALSPETAAQRALVGAATGPDAVVTVHLDGYEGRVGPWGPFVGHPGDLVLVVRRRAPGELEPEPDEGGPRSTGEARLLDAVREVGRLVYHMPGDVGVRVRAQVVAALRQYGLEVEPLPQEAPRGPAPHPDGWRDRVHAAVREAVYSNLSRSTDERVGLVVDAVCQLREPGPDEVLLTGAEARAYLDVRRELLSGSPRHYRYRVVGAEAVWECLGAGGAWGRVPPPLTYETYQLQAELRAVRSLALDSSRTPHDRLDEISKICDDALGDGK